MQHFPPEKRFPTSPSLNLLHGCSCKMETSKSHSFFHSIRSRELHGPRGRKRSYIDALTSDFTEIGALAVQHNGAGTPPLAVSFGKTNKHSHILAVAVEDGYVSLFDSRRSIHDSASYLENAEKSTISCWVAHQNAIFDVRWIKEDTSILTASGDQTIKVWDSQAMKCTAVLTGHTGSVKSLSSHPTNSDLVISGSRDGSFIMWDLRCKTESQSMHEEVSIVSTATVKGAHQSSRTKCVKRGKSVSTSITSVLWLKDEISIATAGAEDAVIKFWDTRNLKARVGQACHIPESSTQKERSHGISSLSQDLSGMFLTASCMDNRIYMYNLFQLDKGPKKVFSGCRIESFYVKSAISPDATHILSGSSDGNVCIWQVNMPHAEAFTLAGHDGEVTAVDWCQSEAGKLATCADDFTVRTWKAENSYHPNKNTPSSIRRRVMAIPEGECVKFFMNEEHMAQKKGPGSSYASGEALQETNSPHPTEISMISTPEAREKRFSLISDPTKPLEKTPEAALKSPTSVLNPPSSLKRRTIRDYFNAAQ